jgi:hypothetical protein
MRWLRRVTRRRGDVISTLHFDEATAVAIDPQALRAAQDIPACPLWIAFPIIAWIKTYDPASRTQWTSSKLLIFIVVTSVSGTLCSRSFHPIRYYFVAVTSERTGIGRASSCALSDRAGIGRHTRNGVVVAKLNGDGLLDRKPAGASPSVRMTASAAINLMITREPAFRALSASLYSCNVVNIYGGKSDEGSQQN